MKKINNPLPIIVKKNKVYFWCACGKSSNQLFVHFTIANSLI